MSTPSAERRHPESQPPASGGPGEQAVGGVQVDPTEKNYLGVLALGGALAALVSMFVPGVGGYLVLFGALVGVVAGIVALRAVRHGRATNRGVALLGLTLGVAELLVLGVLLAFLAVYLSGS